MYSTTIAEVLLGTYYRSGSRNLEGTIREAIRQDYSNVFKIRVHDENKGDFWATLEVLTERGE